LEHVEGHTGNLLPCRPTLGADIKSTKNVFRTGQILYGKLRPYLNKVHLAHEEGICSTDIYVLNPRRDRINPSFAAYFLRSPFVLATVSNAMAGANLPRISEGSLLKIPIPLPRLPEQEHIVRILDAADALRRLHREADRRTADLIPALLHDMFGDPATNPKGWQVTTLGSIGGIGQYGLNAAAMSEGRGIRFIRISDIDDFGRLGRSEPAFVPSDLPDLPKYELRPGDILIARSGATAGKSYVHSDIGERAVFAGYLIRFRISSQGVLPAYVATFLHTSEYWRQLNSLKRAVAQPNVNAKQLASIRLPLPPPELQVEFCSRARRIQEIESAQMLSRGHLDNLFQSLLHRAFEGEL
jgi:type I restriction enzyme S subunit